MNEPIEEMNGGAGTAAPQEPNVMPIPVISQPLAVVELKHSIDTKTVVNTILILLAAMFGLKLVLMLVSYLLKK